MAETNTATELGGLKTFLASTLPIGAKTVLDQWPKEPVAKTLVIRSMPDERNMLGTGIVQVVRQYQILYVDTRIDVVKAVTDAMKSKLMLAQDIPLVAETMTVGRVSDIAGGQPFKTEQSTPLDGDYFTLRMTTYTTQTRAVYENISGARVGGVFSD